MRVYSQIEERAKSLGLPIDFAAMKRTPNTVNAHRLIHWAGLEQRQTQVVDALFQAYFCDGKDIGDTDTLVELATHAGLDGDVVRRLLDGDQDVKDIQDRDAHSREMGVSAVPTFIVGNQHVVPGAQPPELWESVIKELTAT